MFFLGVYRDQARAKRCIESLRTFYADPILSIADGTRDAEYARFCAEKNVRYMEGERLKVPRCRGQWTERYLQEFLRSGEPMVVKLDPDTEVHHKAESFPDAELFCALKPTYSGLQLAGAAVGWSRTGAERILDSGLLRDDEYTKPIYAYHRFVPPLLKDGEELDHNPVSLQDAILSDIARRLSLRVSEWPDVSLNSKSSAFYHKYTYGEHISSTRV